MTEAPLAVGCAAGFGEDRTDAAGPILDTLIARGAPGVLIFEMLAERTLALAQLERRQNPDAGYSNVLEAMVRPILGRCVEHRIPIVSNFGSANPAGAARHIRRMALEEGLPGVRIAVVSGDDLSDARGRKALRKCLPASFAEREIISANVYLGGREIASALRAGAQVVVTGRVADSALTLGPALAHFGWSDDDWDRLACATMAGHLLECGAQVTGGYFADPGFKDVPDLANVGFPIAEIASDGSFVITKPSGTGGKVSERTVKEQLLYEVHDPAAYLTPDVIADIAEAEVVEMGPNRVAVKGARGHPKPETLKAVVFFAGGWLGEGEISYAGLNAEARARFAAEIVRMRMAAALQLRADFIGVSSAFGDETPGVASREALACEVRLRLAGIHSDKLAIERLMREVTALYTCGPAGGGGVRTHITPRLEMTSCLVPREAVSPGFAFLD